MAWLESPNGLGATTRVSISVDEGQASNLLRFTANVFPSRARTPFGRLWYTKPDDAVSYAQHCSRSHDALIRVFDAAGNVTETHEHAGEFKEP